MKICESESERESEREGESEQLWLRAEALSESGGWYGLNSNCLPKGLIW